MTGPDYPAALWIPADPSNYQQADRTAADITRVLIHITDGRGNARNTAGMFATPKAQRDPPVASSAHLIVGTDGLVVQSVLFKDIAWHAHAANHYSIGIEHGARSPGTLGKDDPGLIPTPELYASSAKVVAWICRHYGLQPSRVVILGHKEADPATDHDDCPTGAWDWTVYMPQVQAAYDSLAAVC